MSDLQSRQLDKYSHYKKSVLAAHDFFAALPDPVITRLAARTRTAHYEVGRTIIAKGEEGHSFFAITSGLVKVSSISEDGKELNFNFLKAPEVFGEIALLDGGRRTASVSAITKCELLVLDRRDFLPLLMEEPIIAVKLLEAIAFRFRRMSEQIEDFSFTSPARRLAKVLLYLAERQEPDKKHPHVAITQKELGQAISLSRESTNRYLREWEEAGYIQLDKGGCTITNAGALAKLAGSILNQEEK